MCSPSALSSFHSQKHVQPVAPEETLDSTDSGDAPPDVYEIGKQFYFWKSHEKHHRFVSAKYQNVKEEVLNNPELAGLLSIEGWNGLTKEIAALIGTESALEIVSNGQSVYMYQLRRYEPLDAAHLRALKLYTDFTELSAKFCAILRWANGSEIAGIANWARYLIETVQCFGSSLKSDGTKMSYYRGVSKTFIFKMIATRFHLPLSTTSDVK